MRPPLGNGIAVIFGLVAHEIDVAIRPVTGSADRLGKLLVGGRCEDAKSARAQRTRCLPEDQFRFVDVFHHIERDKDVKAVVWKSQLFEVFISGPEIRGAKWLIGKQLSFDVTRALALELQARFRVELAKTRERKVRANSGGVHLEPNASARSQRY